VLHQLAYHRALAQRLDRSTVDDARHLIWIWRDRDTIAASHASRWEQLFDQSVVEVRRAIGADTPEAGELRQTSPFAGMLSEPERRAILAQVH
jgi:hypothetical protein